MSLADDLFSKAFNVPRDPRSHEYKAGVLYILRRKEGSIPSQSCPYPAGTAQADAWSAGTLEGHRRWADHQITINPLISTQPKGDTP